MTLSADCFLQSADWPSLFHSLLNLILWTWARTTPLHVVGVGARVRVRTDLQSPVENAGTAWHTMMIPSAVALGNTSDEKKPEL